MNTFQIHRISTASEDTFRYGTIRLNTLRYIVSDDSDGQDGAGDAGASAKPTDKAKDTPGVSSAKPVKKRASEAAKAAEAGPSSVGAGRPKRSRAQ